jgi:POT family proton-dependent oligopeptide transporter
LKYFIYLGILVAAVVFGLPFLYPIVINPLLGLLAVGSILIMLSIALKHHGEERKRIFAILILSIFGMLFFTASLQVGSSLVLFIEHSVHHSIAGWKIPTIMFTALYPLAVIVAAPFISSLWKKLEKLNINPLTPMKLSYGLMLAAIAFIFFALAAYSATTAQPHYWPLVLIVLGNLFLGTGELVLAPAIFTAINVLAPIRLKNTMVGLWFIFVALGAYMSGLLAEFCSGTFQTQSGSYNAAIYTHSYLLIAIGVFALGIILAFLSPAIKRLSCGISLK